MVQKLGLVTPIGAFSLHTSYVSGTPVAQITMGGNCSFSGRGILLDMRGAANNAGQWYNFGNGGIFWFQSPCTPSFMVWGYFAQFVKMSNWLNDSQQGGILANWTSRFMSNAEVERCQTSGGAPLVTGNAIFNLRVKGNLSATTGTDVGIGQTVSVAMTVFGVSITTTGTTSDTVTINGMLPDSQITLTPTNASAWTDYLAGHVSIGTKAANSVVINHSNTVGMTFDITATGGL